MLLVFGITLLSLPAIGSAISSASAPAASAAQCPTGDTCVQMPCPTPGACGTVDAIPTQGLGGGQFVRLSFSGFPAGDSGVTVYYCADLNSSAPTQLNAPGALPPVCGSTDSIYDEAPQPVHMYPSSTDAQLPAGSGQAAMQAAEVGSGGQSIPGQRFVYNQTEPATDFFCDGTSANACEVVVTDITITEGSSDFTTDSSNSVAIPITFASATSCPNAPLVQTDSEFGIELLLPVVAHLGCSQDPSTAVNPLDSAVGSYRAAYNLAHGSVNIAFTDDPEAPDVQAQIKSGPFQLIPIALSANTVAFDAQIYSGGTKYGLGQVSLTPTMAAGLMSDDPNWNEAFTADDVVTCSGPSKAAGKKGGCLGLPCLATTSCSLFNQLNFVSGFINYAVENAFWRADASGPNDELLTWLCAAPKVPINWGSPFPPSSYPTESKAASQELEDALGFYVTNQGPPLTTCPAGDQLPALQAAPQNLLTESDPSQQALKALQNIQSGGSGASVAWADMNWAEALYYGMSVASLQNAAGDFVQPDAASLSAAVADATPNADGSITPNYTSSAGDPYPMPDVIYAVVSTKATSAATATSEEDLLNQILDLTGTGGTNVAQLPQGFVPLPASLVSTARTDITKDIVALPPTSPGSSGGGGPGGGSTPGVGGTSSTPQGTTPSADALGPSGLLGGLPSSVLPLIAGLSPLAGILAHSVAAHSGSTKGGPTGPLLGPALPGYALAANSGDTLMTIVLVLGLIGLLAGLLLLGSGTLTRLRGTSKNGAAKSGADPGELSEGGASEIAPGAAPA